MLVSRRVRRRLLLPPGWVALGFLLLLGCQALQPWQRQLKQWNVMQITMPALHVDKSASWNKVVYQSPAQLNTFRAWHTIDFDGQGLSDFFSAASTESAIRKIIADTSHVGGVRIRFLPGATYANLVTVLDIMNYTNQKKYWLDIHYQPSTLYAITVLPTHLKSVPIFLCGTRDNVVCIIPKQPGFQQLLADFWKTLKSPAGYIWVPVALLLAVTICSSMWRLFCVSLNRCNS